MEDRNKEWFTVTARFGTTFLNRLNRVAIGMGMTGVVVMTAALLIPLGLGVK